MTLKNLPTYAPVVLRLGLAAVYMWFGVSQLTNSGMWTGIVPAWATDILSMSAVTLVHINGVLEIIAGTALALGFAVRWVALILCAHLFVITADMGITAVGVRDFGLSFATLALSLFGNDEFSLSYKKAD